MKHETMSEWSKRMHTEGRRKPLRSFKELCKELGVNSKSMAGFLGTFNGPKAKLNHRNGVVRNMWFDPDEFRAWWKEVKLKMEAPEYKKYVAKKKAPKEYRPTEAFRLQLWLRECGGATVKQIREAGFTGVYGGASERMMKHGSLTKESRNGKTFWVATDVDYITRKGANK